jgi:hypothetical protein
MAVSFRRLDYAGPARQPSFCQVAIIRRVFGATVLLEDCDGNPGTIVGHFVEGLSTRLWRVQLCDLDASTIRWFEIRAKAISEVTFSVVPEVRGGFFGMPSWKSAELPAG